MILAGLILAPLAVAHDGSNLVNRSLRYDSLDRTVLNVGVKGFDRNTVVIDGKEYVSLGLPDCAFFRNGEMGQPQLPRISESLLIPDEARMEVKVLRSEYYEIAGIDIAPSKGTILRTVDPASVPYVFGPEYSQNAFFPGVLAEGRDPYILHDVRGMVVDLYPFQYNPATRTLRVYETLEVEVVAAGVADVNVLDRKTVKARPSASFEKIYSDLFGNYAGNRVEPPGEDGDMLIISYGPFMSAVQPLVDWKNTIGISTTMVDVAVIGNNATAIKSYITNLYNTTNLSFVLLVGDVAQVASVPYSRSALRRRRSRPLPA